ncbi:MAG: hypothetical protein A2X59_10145 [Nitrospirae bacterium GWC2_42_7]|nr:MAG: hypothetical protein A2X59_10145 [Nitrospirae bacterium GWC2_42_7]
MTLFDDNFRRGIMNNVVRTLLSVLVVIFIAGNIYAAEKADTDAIFRDPATGMEFVFVKGGCYQMGDAFGDGNSNERPLHEVCVDDFYIGKYKVTQGQWRAIMGSNTSKTSSCGDDCPVEVAPWKDMQDFITKLNNNAKAGKYRLPTEAEWEYAARSGGKKEKYSGGNDVDKVAWHISNSNSKMHPSGTKAPNGLGIYDMSGNVWERCQDWYDENYYNHSPKNNPAGPDSGSTRVVRGGSWRNSSWFSRSSFRGRYYPGDMENTDGFRLVMTK